MHKGYNFCQRSSTRSGRRRWRSSPGQTFTDTWSRLASLQNLVKMYLPCNFPDHHLLPYLYSSRSSRPGPKGSKYMAGPKKACIFHVWYTILIIICIEVLDLVPWREFSQADFLEYVVPSDVLPQVQGMVTMSCFLLLLMLWHYQMLYKWCYIVVQSLTHICICVFIYNIS